MKILSIQLRFCCKLAADRVLSGGAQSPRADFCGS